MKATVEIGLYDCALSAQSLSRLVKGAAFKKAVSKVPDYFFKLSAKDLELKVRPTEIDINIKDAFWHEYMSARRANTKMSTKKSIKGSVVTPTGTPIYSAARFGWLGSLYHFQIL